MEALRCPMCGGEFAASDLLDGDEIVTCLRCESRFSTAEIFQKSTEERIEDIRAKTYSKVESDRIHTYERVEEEKRKIEYEQLRYDYEELKFAERERKFENRQRSLKIAGIVVACILSIAVLLGGPFCIYAFILRGYNSNPSAIRVGISYKDMQDMRYWDAVDLLEEKGFTNITTIDAGGNIFKKSGVVKEVTIDGCDEFYGYSKFLPDDAIIIYYYR